MGNQMQFSSVMGKKKMFEDLSEARLPRTPRRALSATALGNIDRFADWLDRSGANSRTGVLDASNDQLRRSRLRVA